MNALQTTGVKITDTRPGANNRVNCRIQIDQALNNIPDRQTILPVAYAEGQSINNCGQIVGTEYAVAENGGMFMTDTTGALTYLSYGNYSTLAFNINDIGEVYGYYCCDPLGWNRGFKRDAAGNFSTVDNPLSYELFGSNDLGDIVGQYWTEYPPAQAASPFVFKNGQTYTISNILPLNINNMRRWTGIGPSANNIGVVVDEYGTQTTFGFSGAQSVRPYSINESGWIVGCWEDASNNWHGFIRTPNEVLSSYDYPDAYGTCLYGINDSGQMVGSRWDIVPNGVSSKPFVDLSW